MLVVGSVSMAGALESYVIHERLVVCTVCVSERKDVLKVR